MISDIILSSLEIGLIYAIVSLGVFITFKILNFPDLTVDGSLVTGAAISAISIQNGFPIIVTLILSFLGGSIGGLITAFIHVRFNIDRILSGIITLSLLYTINLRIMGSANLSIFGSNDILRLFTFGYNPYYKVFCLFIIVMIIKFLIDWFLRTEIGLQLRAAGDNENTAKSMSINISKSKVILLFLSNGLVGFAGGLLVQDLGFADINMGVGTIILGLAGLMLGSIFTKSYKIPIITTSILLGAILYQFIVNIALRIGLQATDLKLVMGIIVVMTIAITNNKNIWKN